MTDQQASERMMAAALRAARDVVKDRMAARPPSEFRLPADITVEAPEVHVAAPEVHVAAPEVRVDYAADMAPVAAALDRMTDAMGRMFAAFAQQEALLAQMIQAIRDMPAPVIHVSAPDVKVEVAAPTVHNTVVHPPRKLTLERSLEGKLTGARYEAE